jgi:HAD superfamily hydrolase (TIGR01509 family)
MAEPTGAAAGASVRRIAPSPRVILFDLDDTLCDYAGARASRLRLAFAADRHAAFARLPESVRERLLAEAMATGAHGVEHFPELLAMHGVADRAAAEAAMAWYRANRFHDLRLFPDAAATIQALRDGSGGPSRTIGVITNGPADVQRQKIDLLGIDSLADFVVISGEFGRAKPDPAIFHEALRVARASADDAVFIGDAPEFDIAGAQAAGIRSIWMNRARREWNASARAPDHVVSALVDLVALFGAG